MVNSFAPLYGRSLVSVAREEAGSFKWSFVDVGADGSFLWDWGPDQRLPALVAVIAALRDGRLALVADGDHTLGFAEVAVPPGLLRGYFRFVAGKAEADAYLIALDLEGRAVGSRYDRPRFAPPDDDAGDGAEAVVAQARAEYQAQTTRRSKRAAARVVVDRLITEGKVNPTARDASVDRIRKKI